MGNNLIRPYSNRYRQRITMLNNAHLNVEVKQSEEKENLLNIEVNVVDDEYKSIEGLEPGQNIANNNSRFTYLFNCLKDNARECFANTRNNNNIAKYV